MAELLSYAETQKLLDELPREQQKLVADLIPSQITVGGVQRVLQSTAGRAGLDPRPADHPRRRSGGLRRKSSSHPRNRRPCARRRLARQISDSHVGSAGYIPLVTLSPEWETAFAEALIGPSEDRQLAIAPSRLQEFIARFRFVFDALSSAADMPVLLTSGGVRVHVRAVVERLRPGTPVLAQGEISPKVRIRTLDTL